MDDPLYLAREFERESQRIDQLIWDTMAIHAGETVLFCGFGNEVAWIKRARDIGADVSVIDSNDDAIRANQIGGIKIVRGSTTMIPAIDNSYDIVVSFHYLHEVDPFLHANVVSEIARVGKRVVIVEPAPPGDLLGRRIASLYSRAKREFGAFEYYQQLDYWRKLLSIVKADISQQTFAFTRTPPRDAIQETVALILDTMEAEEIPESYLEELKALARRTDAQLLPQARFVLVGAAVGEIPAPSAGTRFREHELLDESPRAKPAAAAAPPATPPPAPTVYATSDEPELPPFIPPKAEPAPAAAGPRHAGTVNAFVPPRVAPPPAPPPIPPPAPIPEPAAPAPFAMPFGLPTEAPPGDLPFGLPMETPAPVREGFGWEWEPPETEEKQRPPQP